MNTQSAAPNKISPGRVSHLFHGMFYIRGAKKIHDLVDLQKIRQQAHGLLFMLVDQHGRETVGAVELHGVTGIVFRSAAGSPRYLKWFAVTPGEEHVWEEASLKTAGSEARFFQLYEAIPDLSKKIPASKDELIGLLGDPENQISFFQHPCGECGRQMMFSFHQPTLSCPGCQTVWRLSLMVKRG